MGKKSKKEKHSKSEKTSKSKSSEQISLGLALNAAFLRYPGLFEELPPMLRAFDEGEFVAIHKIADTGKRQHIESIMQALPLEFHSECGWSKSRVVVNTPISQIVLRILLEYGFVGEPLELSIAEQKASRTPPMILLHLLQKFPALLEELPSLLEQILDGNAVQLGDLPDEELAEELERLLKSLGLAISHEGIGLPDNRDERKSAEKILASFQTIFNDYQQHEKIVHKREKRLNKNAKKNAKKSKDEKKRKYRHQQVSSLDESSESEGSSQSETEEEVTEYAQRSIAQPQPSSSTVIGPQRPTSQDLQYKVQSSYTHHDDQEDDDEEDDDGFGPRVYQAPPIHHQPSSSSAMMVQALPLGYVGTSLPDPSSGYQPVDEEADDNRAAAGVITSEREEWILNPGDSKALRALGGGGADMIAEFGKNRKFASGKTAKKTEEALVIQREFARVRQEKQHQAEQAAAGTADAIDGEDSGGDSKKRSYDQQSSRGPSLMEEHLAKKARNQEESGKERRRFDREKDVLQHRKLNDKEVSQLVTNARELGGRFNQPVVQKSFL